MKRIIFFLYLLFALTACKMSAKPEQVEAESYPTNCLPSWFRQYQYVINEEAEHKFYMEIRLYKDGTCLVMSGLTLLEVDQEYDGVWYYVKDWTDQEHYQYVLTEDGFKIVDNDEVKYIATYIGEPGLYSSSYRAISVQWLHSPGPIWDQYHEIYNWPRKLRIPRTDTCGYN